MKWTWLPRKLRNKIADVGADAERGQEDGRPLDPLGRADPNSEVDLVKFLAELRSNLREANEQAMSENSPARLRLDAVEVTLEVAFEQNLTVGGVATGSAGFKVLTSVEASVSAAREATRSGTQTLTLKLVPVGVVVLEEQR